MAVVWPSKNNFANGDVLTATNMNNIGDTLNVFNPTSATNGQIWVANGSGSGAYTTVTSGGWTQITSGNLSGSTVTSASFSGYKQIHVDVVGATTGTAQEIYVRFNGISTNNYGYGIIEQTGSTSVNCDTAWNNGQIRTGLTTDTAARDFTIDAFGADTADAVKVINITKANRSATYSKAWTIGQFNSTATLSTVSILVLASSFSGGSWRVYGIK